MLPFATKTDLVEALRTADQKLSDLEAFLDMLKAEHNTTPARTELKTLWTKHIQGKYGEAPRDGEGGGQRGAPRATNICAGNYSALIAAAY